MKYKLHLQSLLYIANETMRDAKQDMRQIKVVDSCIVIYSENSTFEEVSPRMSIKNLCNWLNGFISGLDF